MIKLTQLKGYGPNWNMVYKIEIKYTVYPIFYVTITPTCTASNEERIVNLCRSSSQPFSLCKYFGTFLI